MPPWIVQSLVLAVLVAAPRPAPAEPPVLLTFPIPLMVESETQGRFVELARDLLAEAGLEGRIRLLPPPRALQAFARSEALVLFPALAVNFPAVPPARTRAIYIKRDFVFSRGDLPPLRRLADLAGRRVAITSGYPYAPELFAVPGILIDEAATDEANALRLVLGRVDAFVVEEHTGLAAFAATGTRERVQYDPQAPLWGQEVFFACRPDAEGAAFCAKLNAGLAELERRGRWRQSGEAGD